MKGEENICAPNKKSFDITCYDLNTLMALVNNYNEKTKGIKININDKHTKQEIYKKILNAVDCNNDGDVCLLNKVKSDSKYNELVDDFEKQLKPEKPDSWKTEPKKWTSTTNIDNVMNQYDDAYKEFSYLGAVPIDFDDMIKGTDLCISDDLCKIDLKSHWENGVTKIGVVFNLDAHNQPGSHWVSLFVDLKKAGIYYFDSTGREPPSRVCVLMERIKKQGNSLLNLDESFKTFSNDNMHDIENKHEFRKFYNDIEHQTDNSECGVYSIFFLTEMLKGKTFLDFVENIYDDNYIFKFRDVYWRS